MKKPFVALLLLVGAAAMVATAAFADIDLGSNQDPGAKLVNAKMVQEILKSRVSRLNTSAGPDPDTIWVGHSRTNHFAQNYWNIYVGSNNPGTNLANEAIWTWDRVTGFGDPIGSGGGGVADSLAGWWPYRRFYNATGGLTLTDDQRPWWGTDVGNQVNYVINQGTNKRTKGVVGVWHKDAGRNQVGNQLITWTPIGGTASAWCGLRVNDDVSVSDPITRNPFNATTAEFNGENGTNRFPGYMNQWDQMLYRDFVPAANTPVTISFKYRTFLSNLFDTSPVTRVGWYWGDPLSINPGNFISSSAAGANAPADSFMVYAGVPVNDASVTYSDGTTAAVYDRQRRWFSEVIRVWDGSPYHQLLSATGVTDTTLAAPTATFTLSAAQVNALRNAAGNTGNKVRLVFRVKTNTVFSDQGNTFVTNGWGAAMIDDVSITGNATFGDFELVDANAPGLIDNRLGADPLNAWKSTGKPPGIYFHVRPLAGLSYADLCGPPSSPARFCNIGGGIISAGNADDLESSGDSRYLSDRERQDGIISPTINLVTTPGPGPGVSGPPNNMGLTDTMVDVDDDYYIWYDLYAGIFNLSFSGNAWIFGAQSYPVATPGNNVRTWGAPRTPPFIIFNPEPQCFFDIEPLFAFGLIATSNPSGVPDSIRIMLGKTQQCFRFGVSLGCNSTDGAYFDNVSFGLIDLPAAQGVSNANAVGTMSADIWRFINDTFPANSTPALPASAAFDTAGAIIKTGINNAQATGNALRFDIPGDTTLVTASGAGMRVDMVFRILPGPGNYKDNGAGTRSFPPTPAMQLLAVPQNQAVLAAGNLSSFFGSYMANNGEFGSGGGNAPHPGGRWDYLTWNSARMDSSEVNVLRTKLVNPGPLAANAAGFWAAMYHENEFAAASPRLAYLTTQSKPRCFIIDTLRTATTSPTQNLDCDGNATRPAYLANSAFADRAGWPLALGESTLEYTKIIPDGILTAGSHVQYFFRKSELVAPSVFITVPDTTAITPQNGEGPSTDGHRWQQFGVLPDRWKAGEFGGQGMACMLYVDLNDRRGNERAFISLMDSIGGTSIAKRGSHNGWSAPGTADIVGPGNGLTPGVVVDGKNQQPGTIFDMYGVKASESITTSAGALGSRLAVQPTGFAAGMGSRQGPTPEMLRQFYRLVTILSGDVNSGALGPFTNRSQNDVALLVDYLITSGGTAQPRGLYISGDGFAQSETQTGGIDPAHTQFLTNRLGLSLRNPAYQFVSGNTNTCADLITTAGINPTLDIYAVTNTCTFSNDLLQRNPGVSEAVEAAFYENVGSVGPYAASIRKPANPGASRNWVSMLDGFEIEHAFARYCDNTNGRLAYYYNVFSQVFGSLCVLNAAPTVDVPQGRPGQYVNFVKLGNNPSYGRSLVHFGIARAGRVQLRVFDVTGRLVKTLADRQYAAGDHTITWDGTDDNGNHVPRGVYFTKTVLDGRNFNNKMTILN